MTVVTQTLVSVCHTLSSVHDHIYFIVIAIWFSFMFHDQPDIYFQKQLSKRSFFILLFDLICWNQTQHADINECTNTRACFSINLWLLLFLTDELSDSVTSWMKTALRKPHQSGFNLENKNKKKWTHAETNTWSKSEHSLLFEQWPDKIAQSYQHKMNSQRNPREGFHQCSGREKINLSNHKYWQTTT